MLQIATRGGQVTPGESLFNTSCYNAANKMVEVSESGEAVAKKALRNTSQHIRNIRLPQRLVALPRVICLPLRLTASCRQSTVLGRVSITHTHSFCFFGSG
ncbi:hypothetical protein E2C01_034245 [Portunus trituberculatus]|uniref:Uncharacterized protein n=1 Tax=Portunus trituberculatus TaxID=210409 RepID=A0A5B7F0Y0_PORTR|nr:hypothetical protein [Portunus trituberculatus]